MSTPEKVLQAIRVLIEDARTRRGAGAAMNLTVRLEKTYGSDVVRAALADQDDDTD